MSPKTTPLVLCVLGHTFKMDSDGAEDGAHKEDTDNSSDSSSDEDDTLMEQIAQTKSAVSE